MVDFNGIITNIVSRQSTDLLRKHISDRKAFRRAWNTYSVLRAVSSGKHAEEIAEVQIAVENCPSPEAAYMAVLKACSKTGPGTVRPYYKSVVF